MKYGIAFLLLFSSLVYAATDHYYVYNDGFNYGYEEQGATELITVKYLGERDGVHQIVLSEGKNYTVLECPRDCKYAKIYQLYGNDLEDTSAMKLTPEIVGWQMMSDAWNGKMKRFFSDKGYFWVTESGLESTAK